MAAGDELATLLRQGYFEAAEQAFAWLYLRPEDLVLDCGAHVGLYSVLAARATDGAATVLAFEPSPTTAALLEANLAANGGASTQVFRTAIWKSETTLRFAEEAPGRAAYAHVAFEPAPVERDVEATSIDRVVARLGAKRLAFVKLDLEGAEPEAIEGAAASIAGGVCQVLLVEFTEANLQRRGWSTARLGELIARQGLSLFEFSPEHLDLVPVRSTRELWFSNLIATRDPEAVRARLRSASPANVAVARDVLARARACDHLRELEDLARLRQEAADQAGWARRAEAGRAQALEQAAENAAWARRTEERLAAERVLSDQRRQWAEVTEQRLQAEREITGALRRELEGHGPPPGKG
jgi:FkbM family methyltransferase